MTKIYSVYEKTGPESLEKSRVVKEGFSWFAFFLPLIWALYNRVWAVAILLFLVNLGIEIGTEEKLIVPAISLILQGAVMLIAGFSANDWLGKNLLKRGYELKEIIVAKDELGARHEFFRRELRSA